MPNLSEEKKLWKKGFKRVAGLDESGRGCLAGPVIAAAVFIKPRRDSFPVEGIKDSKKLILKKREDLYKILINHPAIRWGIGRVSSKVIDKINILEATKLAMKRAVEKLSKKSNFLILDYNPPTALPQKRAPGKMTKKREVDFLIVDGNFKLDLPIAQKSIKKADEKVFSCAIASIIAKVSRDRIMKRYHKKYPRYGFDKHKGYPTKYHLKMLKKYSPCKIYRKTFGPVKKYS